MNEIKIVKKWEIKITAKFVCDRWFPIYLLPFINIYKGDRSYSLDFGWLFIKFEFTLYYK